MVETEKTFAESTLISTDTTQWLKGYKKKHLC